MVTTPAKRFIDGSFPVKSDPDAPLFKTPALIRVASMMGRSYSAAVRKILTMSSIKEHEE